MSASLVGSEMCIRDRAHAPRTPGLQWARCPPSHARRDALPRGHTARGRICLLYTSDAADDM
eukprot:7916581-Alexandrium_andersonii.AAC.1